MPGIGDPGAYHRLMGKLPYGHIDVIVPVELKDHDPDKDTVNRTVSTLSQLAEKHGLRNSITWDREKHDGAFIARVIGPEEKIDAYRAELSTVTL